MAKLPGAIQGARIVGERFVHSQRQQNPDGRMPLMDHIRELRNRVVKMALGLIAGMLLGFVFFYWAWHIIELPLFLIGTTLAYWSLGRSMHYLLGLTPGGVQNLIQVDQYMSFVMTMLLAFGIAFEVPRSEEHTS